MNKFLVLVIIYTWSFSTPLPNPEQVLVKSPEEAAIICWKNSQTPNNTYETKVYRLLEIDPDNKTLVQLPIPEVKFEIQKQQNNFYPTATSQTIPLPGYFYGTAMIIATSQTLELIK